MTTNAVAFMAGYASGMIVVLVMMLLIGGGTENAKHELFRDIANQRCAPLEALMSADDPYRYVCVEPQREDR